VRARPWAHNTMTLIKQPTDGSNRLYSSFVQYECRSVWGRRLRIQGSFQRAPGTQWRRARRARDQRDGVGRERALAMKSYRVRNEGDPAGGSSTSRWFATQVDFRTLDDQIIRALGSSSILLCCGDGSELGIGYFWVGGGKFGLLLVST